MKLASLFLAILGLATVPAIAQAPPKATRHSAAFDSMQRKLSFLAQNGALAQPDQRPTVLTADEANAYFAEGGVVLPVGVQKVTLQSSPGTVTAQLRVDFDQMTASRKSMNPLLMVFTGVHDVEVIARASASGHRGVVQVQTVSIDGIEVPRMALQYFVERYITPKYPGVGLNSSFRMPSRIDVATVGANNVTITQK
jgi:hypothetical protein